MQNNSSSALGYMFGDVEIHVHEFVHTHAFKLSVSVFAITNTGPIVMLSSWNRFSSSFLVVSLALLVNQCRWNNLHSVRARTLHCGCHHCLLHHHKTLLVVSLNG